MQPSKWDLVLDHKPIPVLTHLLAEVAKLFAQDLLVWPPKVEEPQTIAVLAGVLERPPRQLYQAAFQLTRFDLGREVEAYDDYLRNHRWLTEGLSAKDKPMLLFLSRFMTEQLLGFAEATEGRVKRHHLLDVLADTERHFFKGLTP
ncbi:MAG: hypothetical protein DI536_17630 [Archangium gephyra]|uniref:Uncharacterized protein n=1 Tax=Archangium gephyra TaxID=48 RepID=A0A2W5TBZ4_9BACT|nr:MAG: hypothetical protein DI536_17630 [Archangium gephyra]